MHHANEVRRWLDAPRHEIEVLYFPAYSQELNPGEYLNCDLEAGVHSRPPLRNEKQLRDVVISHMTWLRKQPARMVKYFKHLQIASATGSGLYFIAG